MYPRLSRVVSFFLMISCCVAIYVSAVSATVSGDRTGHQPDSTIDAHEVPGIVVRAHRLRLNNIQIPHQVFTLDREGIEKAGCASLSDVVGTVSGFRAYAVDNPWGRGQIDVGGFYGGGQVDYTEVLVDGVSINNSLTGRVNWSLIDPGSIDHVEAFTGPVSDQHGDYGIGGLVALYTASGAHRPKATFRTETGSFGGFGATGAVQVPVGGRRLGGRVSIRRNDGWREHSEYAARSLSGRVADELGDNTHLTVSLTFADTEEERPGALTREELLVDREQARHDFIGNPWPDRRENRLFLGSARLQTTLNSEWSLNNVVSYQFDRSEEIVTLTSSFLHRPELSEFTCETSTTYESRLSGRKFRGVFGASIDYGDIETEYLLWSTATETEAGYETYGEGNRLSSAAFATLSWRVQPSLLLIAGARVDYVGSSFRQWESPRKISALITDASQSEVVVSPRLAATWSPTEKSALYLSVARAFRSPTLAHLYDSPPVTVPVSPDAMQTFFINNDDLQSMTGMHTTFGFRVLRNAYTFMNVSTYLFDVENEIDFDPARMQYSNIGKARHLGVRISGQLETLSYGRLGINLSYNSSRIRGGEFDGNRQNGVPDIMYCVFAGGEFDKYWARLELSGQGKQYLDEANSLGNDGYTVIDFTSGIQFLDFTLATTVSNLLNDEFNYTGYVDVDGTPRFYPAIGRAIYLSLAREF